MAVEPEYVASAEEDGWDTVRSIVFLRDRGCIAVQDVIPASERARDPCRDRFGQVRAWDYRPAHEQDHVKERPALGIKAPDDVAHLVVVCYHHHQDGWATSHRDAERAYLASKYPATWAEWLANQAAAGA